jgi:hypothetical protein
MLPFLLALTMLQPLSGIIGPLGSGRGIRYDPEILRKWAYYPSAAESMAPAQFPWTYPENILDIYGAFAYTQMGSNGNVSDLLKGSQFGFMVPAGSKIVGVLVEAKIWAGFSNVTTLQLCNAAGLIGQPKDFSVSLAGFNWYSLGANDDTWGVRLTPAIVNSDGFGVTCKVRQTENSVIDYEVDIIQLTIYYKSRHKP